MNRPVPSGPNDLSQSLRIVLIRLVDLHLEGSACVPDVETNDFEAKIITEFMHEPWCHRSGLDPYAGVISRMPADQNGDLFWMSPFFSPEITSRLPSRLTLMSFSSEFGVYLNSIIGFGHIDHRQACPITGRPAPTFNEGKF